MVAKDIIETRDEMIAWIQKEFGKSTVKMVEKFLDAPELHPYEERMFQGGRDKAFDNWSQE